ncbi:hypothetical protein Bbelb_054280 [Branchiostoma belcheri]|nr:hypothetical protein Bbelb_054280 [Branchiostoma belcheri]
MDMHVSFVDFSRAFDTIDHGSLLHSLAKMGIRRDLWCCVRSYLSDRVQRVRWDSGISAPRPVLVGTPQGGIISPSLFVLAMNSLDNNIPQSVTPVNTGVRLTRGLSRGLSDELEKVQKTCCRNDRDSLRPLVNLGVTQM